MSKFGHLKKMNVAGTQTVEMPLHAINATLVVAPALESNTHFFNASLKASRKNVRAVRNGNITAALLDETRETDRELYARFILKGWSGVTDESGAEVKFDSSLALEFLQALPDWLFDEVREFCGTPANFISDEQIDVGKTSGNSPKG